MPCRESSGVELYYMYIHTHMCVCMCVCITSKNVGRGTYLVPFGYLLLGVSVKKLILGQINFISEKGLTIFFENH